MKARNTKNGRKLNEGGGYLDQTAFMHYGCADAEPYVLTLGEWGHNKGWTWNQTSRPGKNVVLQLNLPEIWSRRFHKAVRENPNEVFSSGHPISETRAIALAWARLDRDFDTDEALIEEIQSDLVREVGRMHSLALQAMKDKKLSFGAIHTALKPRAFWNFLKRF